MIPTKSLSHEEYLKKKRNKKLWRFGIAVLLIMLIIGILSYLSHRQEVRISRVELNGGILVTQADIESRALEYMYGSHLWLFPRNNAFWYPHNDLKGYFKETFKRIDKIEINRKGFMTLVINIKERKPFALWCTNYSTSTTTPEMPARPLGAGGENGSEDCYFIDQNSTVFAKAPYFSGDAYFKYYGILNAPEISPIGKEYMASTTEFSEISNFVSRVRDLSIRPLYLIAKNNDEFSLVISGGGEIYFNLKESLSVTSQNLQALLRTPAFASTTGDLPIEYIDLRYGNKLFYKLR